MLHFLYQFEIFYGIVSHTGDQYLSLCQISSTYFTWYISFLVGLFLGIMHSFYNSYTVLLLLLLNLIVVTIFITVKVPLKNPKPHHFVFIRWEHFRDTDYIKGWVRIYLHCMLIYMTRTVEYWELLCGCVICMTLILLSIL